MGDGGLTLHEVSEQLGVHYMTVYRYVRLGLLPATKKGSVWSVAEADVRGFETASPASGSRRRRGAPWAKRLEARLLAGDLKGASGVVDAAVAGGLAVRSVYTDLVAPAMRSIGERWAVGELDVADEHRASAVAVRLTGRLSHRMSRRGRAKGTIVIGTASGEMHGLPVSMAADLLRAEGFDVVDLGCDLPPGSFASALSAAGGVVAVAVSATSPGREAAVADTVRHLKAARPDVPVYVGGAMVADAGAARALGADRWAATVDELAADVSAGSG